MLSVVINTKNAASTLDDCLSSIKDLADEIIVVDMHSGDKTLEIAQKFNAKIFVHQDVGYVEPARNFALSKATGDWILVLDADEEISEKLKFKIAEIVRDPNQNTNCFYLPRLNLIFNKALKHTNWWPDYQLRLFRRGSVEWSDEIHAVPITYGQVKELPAEEKAAIIHHSYQSVSQFIERLNRYTTIESQGRQDHQYLPIDIDQFHIKSSTLFKSWSREFLNRYFAGLGVGDGVHGMALSLLQSYYELAVTLKIWEKTKFEKFDEHDRSGIDELRQFQRDLNFWLADYEYAHSHNLLLKLFWRLRKSWKI